MRPTLAASLLDILDSLVPTAECLRVTGLDLEFPLELTVVEQDGAPLVLAGPPRWRWTTDFDCRPGRLRLALGEVSAT